MPENETPDVVIPTPETPEVPETPTLEQAEFAKQMEYALSDGQEPVAEDVATPETPEETPVAETTKTPEVPETPAVVEEAVNPLKDLGFDNIEDAKKEIEALRTLKANEGKPKDIEFADEDSKKIFELIRQGKKKEVGQWIQAQELLSDVETMNDESKLKLYIKMQNPKFDKELIEDEYNSIYNIDEDEYLDDPMKLRKERLKLEQRIENDVVKAGEYFSQYAKKVELPDISQPEAITVDKEYEALKASMQSDMEFEKTVITPAIQSLTEDKIKFAINVDDANNQMNFGVSITPEKKDFDEAKKDALNFDKFIASINYDDKGNFKSESLISAIMKLKHFDKYVQSAARQAVNAERLRVVAEKNGGGGLPRDTNVPVEKSEFQKQMDFALS